MTENEHLLLCLAEECDEVGQRVMKALRFGLDEVQPSQPLNNAERIVEELRDLISVAEILRGRGILADAYPSLETIRAKEAKIAKFMEIGRQQGALSPVAVEAEGA
jgi:NTP pyrophosphatase (non-canonical NTP hydrolase)